MKKMITLLSLLALVILAGCVSSPAAAGPKPGELAEAIMGRTPVLDGKFDEPAWEGASWDIQSNVQNNPLESPKDAEVKFAVVADSEYLYVAFDIMDDVLVSGTSEWPDYYLEDSAEFFVDPNNAKFMQYDKDDAQVTIAAGNIGRGVQQAKLNDKGMVDFVNGLYVSGKGCYADIPVKAIAIKTDKGWACEAAMPLKTAKFNIVPKAGLQVGWNIQYNDNDRKAGRDHMLVWSTKDRMNKSWMQSYYFGTIVFVEK